MMALANDLNQGEQVVQNLHQNKYPF